jgi:TPR repeat protein
MRALVLLLLAGCHHPSALERRYGYVPRFYCGFDAHRWIVSREGKERCEKGDLQACLETGEVYEHGSYSVPAIRELAVELYQRACDGGLAEGCAQLERLRAAARPLPSWNEGED